MQDDTVIGSLMTGAITVKLVESRLDDIKRIYNAKGHRVFIFGFEDTSDLLKRFKVGKVSRKYTLRSLDFDDCNISFAHHQSVYDQAKVTPGGIAIITASKSSIYSVSAIVLD